MILTDPGGKLKPQITLRLKFYKQKFIGTNLAAFQKTNLCPYCPSSWY